MKLFLGCELSGIFLMMMVVQTSSSPDLYPSGMKNSNATNETSEAAVSYPDGATAGVPVNSKLKTLGSSTLDIAGATISNRAFQGTVTITAPNVMLRNCKITASGWAALNIRADGVTVENCDLDGQAVPGIRGISVSGSNITIRGCNIHDVEDGIYLTGSSNIKIESNFIHDLQSQWDSPHFDGIATDGGVTDILIRGNTVINHHQQTSAVMLSNYSGPITNVRVEGNRLIGGGYTIYSDGQFHGGRISNVSFSNNRLGRGHYGYASIAGNVPRWSGNVDDISDQLISK